MADTTIKINPAFSSEIEFEVKIDGMENQTPEVRFVVVSKSESCNYSVTCSKVKGKAVMWTAKIPSLKHIAESSCPFYVEVIVDGYYFKPAEGIVQLLKDPSVKFDKSTDNKRPTVTTSFTVKQNVKEDVEKVGQYSPTNQLLVPEREPKQSDIKTGEQGDVIKRDAQIDTTRLSDIGDVSVPGATDHEPQAGAEREPDEPVDDTPLDVDVTDDEFEAVLQAADELTPDDLVSDEPFDPRKVAESIIKSTIGKTMARPITKGIFFATDASGAPMVEGLDSAELAAAKRANAQKVRNILTR